MMLTVSEISSKEIWNNFLEGVQPHSFLHSWQWGELNHPAIRFGVFNGTELIAIAMAIITDARRGKFLLCPHGPIIGSHADEVRVIRVVTEYLQEMAKRHDCAWIRVAPLLEDTDEHRKIFDHLGYRNAPLHVHPEFASILDLAPSEDVLLQEMRKTTRYSIKKAEKDGVTSEISNNPDDIERFWKLYDVTAKRQQFVPFSKDLIHREFKVFGENAFWVFSEHAAAMIVTTSHEAFYHHGASLHHPTASYLVQWAAIREAKRRGKKYYNFWGVWPEHMTKHPQAGLSQFKRGFGGFEEAYVHTQDLPLTSRYWLNYAIEKIRKLQRGF